MAPPDAAHRLVAEFNRGREPERTAMKFRAMRSNAFVFLRGAAHLFYRRYIEAGFDRSAPPAWNCNDLHLENFGTYLGDNGLTYFDVNDFDEAALAPADWDIVRLAASILVAAKSLGIAKGRATAAAKLTIATYLARIAAGKPQWIERKTADGPIGALIDGLRRRTDLTFLEKRTVVKKGVRRLLVDGERALVIDDADRPALGQFFDALRPAGHPKSFFRMIDAARRVAGTGSLGLPRYVVLVEGNGSPDGNVLVDLKAAVPSAVAPFSPYPQPDWATDAARVVAVQTRCQAVTPAFLQAAEFLGQPFLLKMLQPTADRLDLARLATSGADFESALAIMASVTAWSQLRATGRDGSATTDDLMRALGQGGMAATVFDRARAMAAVVDADFADYAAAFDSGDLS